MHDFPPTSAPTLLPSSQRWKQWHTKTTIRKMTTNWSTTWSSKKTTEVHSSKIIQWAKIAFLRFERCHCWASSFLMPLIQNNDCKLPPCSLAPGVQMSLRYQYSQYILFMEESHSVCEMWIDLITRLMRLSDGSSSVFLMVHKRRIPRFRLQVILWLDSNLARKHERIRKTSRKTSTSHNWHNFTAVCTALTALTSRKLYGYRRHENHETTELKVPKLGPTWGSLVSWSKKGESDLNPDLDHHF